MYADRISAGRKRFVGDRLDGGGLGQNNWPSDPKRQRQSDDKWKRGLYDDDREPQTSKPQVGPRDLRLQLQKKNLQQAFQGGKDSGIRDLREKLSGSMHSQPPNTDLPKAKPASESGKLVKRSAPSAEAPVPETKKTPKPTSSKRMTQQKLLLLVFIVAVLVAEIVIFSCSEEYSKSNPSVDGLLQSLGLQKYLITFQAEEVDMTALMHMTDEDLKALGIPMGPRKKILLALESRTKNGI